MEKHKLIKNISDVISGKVATPKEPEREGRRTLKCVTGKDRGK
jgi:hypothetical protein